MEEVGKYESIQDRIKRLTKNQSSTTTISLTEQIQSPTMKLGLQDDGQKQNFSTLNFAKKRQNSQNNLKTISINKQPLLINERLLQPITNTLTQQPSYAISKQSRTEISKNSHQYMIRKPLRESFQDHVSSQFEFTNSYTSMRRKDSAGFLGGGKHDRYEKYTSRAMVTEQDEEELIKKKSFLYEVMSKNEHQQKQEGMTGRSHHGIKKSLINQSYKLGESHQINYRNSIGDETPMSRKPQIMKYTIPKDEPEFSYSKPAKTIKLPAQALDIACTPEPRSRMLTKCRSGFLQRMPGKIIKNR